MERNENYVLLTGHAATLMPTARRSDSMSSQDALIQYTWARSLLKDSIEQPLPHGRGSVTAWKHEASILSRARKLPVVVVTRGAG